MVGLQTAQECGSLDFITKPDGADAFLMPYSQFDIFKFLAESTFYQCLCVLCYQPLQQTVPKHKEQVQRQFSRGSWVRGKRYFFWPTADTKILLVLHIEFRFRFRIGHFWQFFSPRIENGIFRPILEVKRIGRLTLPLPPPGLEGPTQAPPAFTLNPGQVSRGYVLLV